MKISEMNNEQATEAIIRLAEPLGNICDDEEIADMFKEISNMGDVPMVQTLGKMIPRLVAYGFKKHVDDLYEIVGALTMQGKDKVKKMNFKDTIEVLKDSYDDVLASFFTRSSKVKQANEEK